MLDNKGFDLWADGYDLAVGVSDEENSYPFAGYKRVFGLIFQTIMERPHAVVLDLGFGTGTLTAKLYENGCTIFGQDFSEGMLSIAKEKMPGAQLFAGDLICGLVPPLLERDYDFITATYSLHHLTDEQKRSLIRSLMARLVENGALLIGDVAFENRAELEKCRREAGDKWDDDEIYFVADELRKDFPELDFKRVSHCAGVLTLRR